MVRGRKPKPTNLKIISGNPGHRPLNKNEPAPRAEIPKAPPFLSKAAKKEWRKIAPQLARLGLLSKIDATALAGYCQAVARMAEAEQMLAELGARGLVVPTKEGNLIPNPLIGIANRSWNMAHKFLVEFGMTPSSRSRLSVNSDPANDGWTYPG